MAFSLPGKRGRVYHGELRCHSNLESKNRSTAKSQYGRITLQQTVSSGVRKDLLNIPRRHDSWQSRHIMRQKERLSLVQRRGGRVAPPRR